MVVGDNRLDTFVQGEISLSSLEEQHVKLVVWKGKGGRNTCNNGQAACCKKENCPVLDQHFDAQFELEQLGCQTVGESVVRSNLGVFARGGS